jgi:hypothetical protein
LHKDIILKIVKFLAIILDAKKANSDLFLGAAARLTNSLNLDAMIQYDPSDF